jgi:PIN domain nuclease of toxin-antitoxin system
MIQPEKLSRAATAAIRRARASRGIALADISLWELAQIFSRGTIRTAGTVENSVADLITDSGVLVRHITPEIAALATQFPESYSRDPADRVIGATARAEGIALVTKDERMQSCPLLTTIW